MVRELGGRDRLALAAAAVAVLNPITWFDSVVWGQVDSFGVVFLLLGLRELWRDRPERSAIYTVIAAIIKPQLGILIPIVAVVTIRRALWPDGGFGHPERTGRPIRILTTGLAGFLTAVVACLPFGLSVIAFSSQPPFISSGLLQQVGVAAGGYPYLTVNAYNPWALIPSDLGQSLATAGLWVCDYAGTVKDCGAGVAVFGGIPAVVIGTALLVLSILVDPGRRRAPPGPAHPAGRAGGPGPRLLRRADPCPRALWLPVLRDGRHPRRDLMALADRLSRADRGHLRQHVRRPDDALSGQPVRGGLARIGPAIRSQAGVTLFSLMHAAAFAWAFVQLRAGARERLEDEMDAASVEDEADWLAEDGVAAPDPGPGLAATQAPLPAWEAVAPASTPPAALMAMAMVEPPRAVGPVMPAAAAAAVAAPTAPMPTWTPRPSFEELGIIGWFRARLNDLPIRPDRSALLRKEGGGRLDRLDLWFVIVLIVGSMVLRTYRLEEPYQMHFDEVYHARTAAEFLQDWRYGLSHDIYEWTHPHLAKYAMAVGLVLWGEDDVAAQSDLGVPVVAVAIEPRRIDETVQGSRAGERLHVATGTEIRTYDLRTRALISVIAAPGVSALAVDETGGQLVVGYTDGRLATVDFGLIGDGGVSTGVEPTAVATLDHPIDHLMVTSNGADAVAASSDRLSTVDLSSGDVLGSLDLPKIADLSSGGSGSALVANADDVTDHAAVASSLANILDTGSAADFQARLDAAKPGTTVVLGNPGSGATRTALDAAIADGTLKGIHVDSVERVAVATGDGVAFIDPARASLITTIVLGGGAHGLAMVTGLDEPRVYATAGTTNKPEYHVIAVGGDSAKDGPVDKGPNPLPGLGSLIAYDEASQMVHILGLAPGAPSTGPWTVYVVEPHGNAVFADAKLPAGFVPSAWGADFNPDYPSQDRQQLLVFDGAGASAAIDTGSHAFAWRFPGVIAGALTVGLLYLLARILFRRRLVAGLVGLFVIFDGMFFVQSRIGMNDVYVGLFIVAAYTVFAAVWTGWWRGRGSFWIAMPIIGLLLGLALASKWVAAYAIGALLLLILVRSALGRVLAILGLIGLTGVLGYMAISVPGRARAPPTPGFGNLTFLLIMIALTLLAVVVAVVHPIAWTDEELRFAVGAPVVLGTIVFFVALAAGKLDDDDHPRIAEPDAAAAGDRARPRVGRRRRAVHARRTTRVRAARRAAGARRPDPPARRARARRPTAGSGQARCWACRWSGWPPAWSSCRSSCTSSRTSRGP